jgi:4-hydroxybutyryl-CoA dehydratase/vinylacetyl-CoA-Delta-isomerase
MHGAGSPQAQRIQIARQAQLEFKKRLARALAGIGAAEGDAAADDPDGYMARVLETERKP